MSKTSKDLQGLIPDAETAKILGITVNKLYKICDRFDEDKEDEWELTEGEHFEWLRKDVRKRLFYESGAMAIAKYLQESAENNILGIFEKVVEKLTSRRKKVRRQLVKRRIINEFASLDDALVKGDLVFMQRRQVIKILATNGKGFNFAVRREQSNSALTGREPMEIGIHFDKDDADAQIWSQRGIARVAKNMSENLSKKPRRAWTDAVAEIIEEAVNEQRLYLTDFEARVRKAMKAAKEAAQSKCKVTLQRRTATNPFDLHVHHLFDKESRPDIADNMSNLLVMHEDIHRGFHSVYGYGACEPQDFIEYITTVEIERFKAPRKRKHLTALINRLEQIQRQLEL